MLKNLLSIAFLSGVMTFSANADNQVFSGDELGDINGVSDNGRFAAITDGDNNLAYLWDSNEPDWFMEITADLSPESVPSGMRIVGTNAYDVTNDGMVVGCLIYADGKSNPAYYINEEWVELPVPANSLNTRTAVCVTPDGSVIAGYFCLAVKGLDGDYVGRYFPCQWKLNDEGEYDLFTYDDIDLPDHQGFIPMTQSADGRVIGGQVYCGIDSTIPGLIVDGELKLFDEITHRWEPWEYMGKWYCGRDEDGKQIWTEDPDDPRIVLFVEEYIDGFYDGYDRLSGAFDNCDINGNFYGMRTRVSNVSDDGRDATLRSGACIYNINTDKWTYNTKFQFFTAGTSPDFVFANDNQVVIEGVGEDINEYYDFTLSSPSFGITKISDDATVLGGVRAEFSEAIMDYVYFPYVIMTEESGCKMVYGGPERPTVMTGRGTILVRNADSASVYGLNGRLIGEGTSFEVAPGTYVVKTGDVSAKVIVR